MIENASGAPNINANATILRIGQIIPAKGTGSQLWNPTEMIPLMVRSALTTGALPDTPGSSDQCSWIDVDVLSAAIIEIGGIGDLSIKGGGGGGQQHQQHQQLVYNLVHPRPFSWKDEFLPALRSAGGLEFETTNWSAWFEKLRGSELDVRKNPSRKLLDFWGGGGGGSAREDGKRKMTREVIFDTTAAGKTDALRTAEKVVSEEYVARLVAEWKKVW